MSCHFTAFVSHTSSSENYTFWKLFFWYVSRNQHNIKVSGGEQYTFLNTLVFLAVKKFTMRIFYVGIANFGISHNEKNVLMNYQPSLWFDSFKSFFIILANKENLQNLDQGLNPDHLLSCQPL